MKSDLVIIGGGIIGILSAYELAQSGIKVTLIDKGRLGQESSWAAGGILCPLLPWNYDNSVSYLTDTANDYYQHLSTQLYSQTKIDIEYWQCGLTIVEPNHLDLAQTWCTNNKVNYKLEIISGKAHLFLPFVSQLRTPRIIEALTKNLKMLGVIIHEETNVSECLISNNHITGVKTSKGVIQAEQLLICAGAWVSNKLFPDASIELPAITPVLGQIIAFDGQEIMLDTILYKDDHYLVPRKDGLILAGSTLEYVGFNNKTTEIAKQTLFEKSVSLLPELKNSKITHHWSGLRPGSIDNRPIIGPHSNIDGLFLNCGHFRYGVSMAPQSAKIIAQWISHGAISNIDRQYMHFQNSTQIRTSGT